MLITVIASLPALIFGWGLYATLRTIKGVRSVDELDPKEPAEGWPALSIIVPACNEEVGLETALKTLLEVQYPALEIVAINDRSTDKTGEIIDRLAKTDERLTAVHVETLPDGWLGKVHALSVGYARSEADWVLLADADVHLEADTMQRVIGWAEAQGVDHVTAIPATWRSDSGAEACWAFNLVGLMMFGRIWRISDPDANAHAGCGAFNLVRKTAFDATEGFDWFKLDVADDWAVGLMMKRNRKRSAMVNGRGRIHLPWYRSFGEMLRGMEKNNYAILARYNIWRGLAYCVGLLVLGVGPLLVPLLPGTYATGAGVTGIALMLMCSVLTNRWLRRPLTDALLLPLGGLLNALIMAQALIHGSRRGGVAWRGTVYRKEDMLPHMRVKL